jgi:50S ribosomal subunit-associated GTPase HflX
MLILDIFAGRATTNEGRLQVKLAQLKYTLPRISGISNTSGRFGSAGVGMRGPGETKLEMDKRTIRENIAKLEKECFSSPWSEAGIRSELSNENAVFFTAKCQGETAGYMGMHTVLDECYIYLLLMR